MRKLFLSAALAGLLTSACTVGPNYAAPPAAIPAAFSGQQPATPPGAAIDPATWWTAFGDPELTRLVEAALRDNPSIAIAASRVRQARLQELQARAQYRPSVNADANVTDVRFSKNAGFSSLARAFGGSSGGSGGGSGSSSTGGVALPGNSITTFAAGFDASWELDLFGGGRRNREASRAQTEAAVWSQRDAAVTLAAEVADAYIALRNDQAEIAILNQELARQQRGIAIANHIAQVGLTPAIDVIRQRGAAQSTQARLEPLRADVQVRLHALGVLTGQPPETLAGLATQPAATLGAAPVIPAGLPSDLLRRRPDIRAAERRLAASTAEIGVAVADLYPKFSLTGALQLISTALRTLISTDSLQATGTGAIQFPLLDWGRRKATVGLRREDREQAYQQYRQTVLEALKDVEDPLAQIDAERRRNATLRQALADQQRTARAVEAQYRAGTIAQDPLLNAQTQVLAAREQVEASDAQLRQLSVALFKAIGGGWQENMASPGPVFTDKKK